MPASLVSSIAFEEERPSKVHPVNKTTNDQSMTSISLHEEQNEEKPVGKHELMKHENHFIYDSSHHTHTRSHDDIQFEEVDDGASNSAQSLQYKIEAHNPAGDIHRHEDPEQLNSVAEGGHKEAAADLCVLYPPPRRLPQRAAKAAQGAHPPAGPPLTPRNRSPQRQLVNQLQVSEDLNVVPGSENTLMPEPTPAGFAPIPIPGVKHAEYPDVVVTEHTRHFPGHEWASVVATSLDELKDTVASETAVAIGVELQCVQVTIEVATTDMSCDLVISHDPAMTTSEIDDKLSGCHYEATMALLDACRHQTESRQYSVERTHADHIMEAEEEMPTPTTAPPAADARMKLKKRSAPMPGKKRTKMGHTPGEGKTGSSASSNFKQHREASTPSTLVTPYTSVARTRLEKALNNLPGVLITPRVYHLRSPRPGAQVILDGESQMYIEDPNMHDVGPTSHYPVSTMASQHDKRGSRSVSVSTPKNWSSEQPLNIPPQHVQRGVASVALRQRPVIQVQQETKATAAPSDDQKGQRPVNSVEHTAETHSVSRRSRSRSPQQVAVALEVDELSDPEPEHMVPMMPVDASDSPMEKDDYALMTEGVKETMPMEEGDSGSAHLEGVDDKTSTDDEPVHDDEGDTGASSVGKSQQDKIIAVDEDIDGAAVAEEECHDPEELPSPENAHPNETQEADLEYPSEERNDEQDPVPTPAPNPFV